jgi:hypothetical protein
MAKCRSTGSLAVAIKYARVTNTAAAMRTGISRNGGG